MEDSSARRGILSYIALFPDLTIAATGLLIWIAPSLFRAETVEGIFSILVFEFIAIHATGIMGIFVYRLHGRVARWIAALVSGAFYSILVGWWAWSSKDWWLLGAFWLLMLNRALPLFLERVEERAKQRMFLSWGLSAATFFGCTFVTTFIPIPRLGFTAETLQRLALPGEGLWVDEPQRGMLCAILYFSLVAWIEHRLSRK